MSAPKKKDKKPKPKQVNVPGTERKIHKDITAAAEAYVEARDERMEWTKHEVESNEKLVKTMEKHELTEYIDEDAELHVTIPEHKIKAKVRRYRAAEPDEE